MSKNTMRGFSLVELMVIIVITSILAIAITTKNMPVRSGFDLASVSEQLIRDIRYTQILSMALNGSYSIQLNTNSYQIKNPNGTDFSYPAISSSPITFPAGVTISPSQTISFDSIGRPSAATTVTILVGGNSRILTLRAQTGFIDG